MCAKEAFEMGHTEDMLNRLPHLYRDGELLRQILALPAVQLEILDEDRIEVQRSHGFDAVLELEDAAKLAAILDFKPEPWQTLPEFRAWVHTLRDAMLERGAVTKAALQEFVTDYVQLYQTAVKITSVPPLTEWRNTSSTRHPGFVENPLQRREEKAPSIGGIEPLHQFQIEQRGLNETVAGFLLVGLPTAPESVPVIANLASGQALIFLGNIPPGTRLWLRPTAEGGMQAILEGEDVSDRLRSISGLMPGTPWNPSQVEQPARAITLKRGKNDLWFLPVAHFDTLGLDRFLLALADLLLAQGRYDQTQFDHALFYQEAAVMLHLTWLETQPASFEIHLPAGALLNRRNELAASLQERDRLEFSLNQAVQTLKAAGVEGKVILEPFREVQQQGDRLYSVLPPTFREIAPTGADRLPNAGGVFEVTSFEDSTYR